MRANPKHINAHSSKSKNLRIKAIEGTDAPSNVPQQQQSLHNYLYASHAIVLHCGIDMRLQNCEDRVGSTPLHG
eukprot:3863706-Amphidinium_carterae.1